MWGRERAKPESGGLSHDNEISLDAIKRSLEGKSKEEQISAVTSAIEEQSHGSQEVTPRPPEDDGILEESGRHQALAIDALEARFSNPNDILSHLKKLKEEIESQPQ
jgi:hypothetical protein